MFKIGKLLKGIMITLLCIILVVFLVLLTAPLLFKNQLMDLAKTELNKMFLAKVEFKDLNLSFIRNFPDAYIALDGLQVTGVDDFEDELLVAFDRFSVTVDIMSLIRMENIEVKSILLDKARLNGHILEDGRANWNIMKPGETAEDEIAEAEDSEEDTAEEIADKEKEKAEPSDPFKFKVGLNKFEIRDMTAAFLDEKNKMNAEIGALNFNLRGDMKRENVDLNLKLAIDGIDFLMNEVRFASKVNVGFVSQIAADLKNMSFIIKQNQFNLNDFILKFDGSVDLRNKDIIADVTFATEKTDFKSLLSLVPVVYMSNFKDLKTTGSLALSGDIKGIYNEKTMPNANVKLSVENATFSYPQVPKSIDSINIDLKAHYDGEVFDRTTADLDKFSFVIVGNPFAAEAHVKTPESDMQVAAKFEGKIDIDSIQDIIPLKDMTLSGLLETNLSVAGKMSTLQNERYEDFQADGLIKLSRFNFVTAAFPKPINISSMQLNFTPRRVELANLDVIVGNTDVALNGTLENFIPFIFNNAVVKGTLALKSNNIDLNEFMGGEKKEKEEKKESGGMSIIEVPKNIDFALNVNIAKILFDKLVVTNASGGVTVKDGKLDMRNLTLYLLDGSVVLNGAYNTQNINSPFIDLGMNINQFDISSTIASFEFIQKILPEPNDYAGKVSASLTLYSPLNGDFSPVPDKINSKGRLQTNNLQIRNSKIFAAVADISKSEIWRTPTLDRVDVGFEIKNGRVYIEDPIAFNIPPSRIELKGDQGLDMTMNYRLDAFMPVSAIGSGATDLLKNIPGGSNIKEVQLTGTIKGTVKEPQVSLNMADMASAIRTQVVDAARTQVNAEINREIDNIMAEANRQADNIRREANSKAQKAIDEAKKISDPARRMIAVKAAEAAAPGIRREGENLARSILAEAQKKADALKRN